MPIIIIGPIGDPSQPIGNGILLWFEVDDFQEVVARARQLKAPVVRDVPSIRTRSTLNFGSRI